MTSTMNGNGSGNFATCYNKGCGKQFDLSSNSSDSCQHHPGVPVFHDALKGWSCCNKKSTDFTQFLSYPGCTKAAHSNVKPEEPIKPLVEEIVLPPMPITLERKTAEMTPRPTNPTPVAEMNRTVAASLAAALLKLSEAAKETAVESNGSFIPIGTPCKNSSCKSEYQDDLSSKATCTYHSGSAVFHEGMKYWSCCQRKTSDFDNFLNQEGCTHGTHVWFKEKFNEGEQTNCRFDFHQASGFYIVTFYAKNAMPEKTSVKVNAVHLDVAICFEAGTKAFTKSFELFGVIKPEESVVNFFQTKVEIKLKKADAINWPTLEYTAK